MPSTTNRHTRHSVEIAAPAPVVYDLLADATAWPEYFAPTVHVTRTALDDGPDGTAERLRIWATANGAVTSWTSRRDLDRAAGRIRFRQEVSRPPVASMTGTWIVTETAGGCRLDLEHDFTAVDDDPDGLDWITKATNDNSETELANLKSIAEQHEQRQELDLRFADSVEMRCDVEAAYGFLNEAAKWPDRLPHVVSMELTEDEPGVQQMTMVTSAKDGSTHTTESVRICFPGDRIVYKQLVTPSLMSAHAGCWSFTPIDGGVRVTSEHRITLRSDTIAGVLGETATIADAGTFVRAAAGGNSLATLRLAKAYVEANDD